MPDSSRDLFIRGMAAAKAGERKEARFYLEWAQRLQPPSYLRADIWYWLSEVSDDLAEKRSYIEEILASNPGDVRARRKLAILDGKLQPDPDFNPDFIKPTNLNDVTTGKAQRFKCPTCGGQMTYSPEGMVLACDYCDSRQKLAISQTSIEEIPEENFLLALATSKGHLKSVQTRLFTCQRCGAAYFFTPTQLSGICPYCDTAYVSEEKIDREIVIPNSLIPFSVNERAAKSIFRAWLAENNPTLKPTKLSGRGVYLPCWTFDIGGQISWHCEIYQRNRWVATHDQKVILHNDILVLATRKLPIACLPVFEKFNLKDLTEYDPRFLANWMAETYDITLSDASLRARKNSLERERFLITHNISTKIRNLSINTSSLMVESYRLILLPFWLCHFWVKERRYDAAINGQNGLIDGEFPLKNAPRWLQFFQR
jgi:Zn finger protein HypA/HybF involved in hydrogenase expression